MSTTKETSFFKKPLIRNATYVVIFAATFIAMRAYQKRNLLKSGTTKAPAVTLQSLNGQHVTSADWQGKRVLLFFFAPWCSACKRNVDALNSLSQKADPNKVVIAAVALRYRNIKEVQAFKSKYNVTFPVLLGAPATGRAFRVDSYPTTYVIDEKGMIADSFLGYTPETFFSWAL